MRPLSGNRRVLRHLPKGAADVIRGAKRAPSIDEVTGRFMLGVVVPLWLGAGLLDWHHHRRTNIETTAGTRESVLHGLMLAEASVPVLLGTFCEINAGALATAYGAVIAHESTALWDMSYAEERRRVTPAEQHVHSFLEAVPVMTASFLTVMFWDQARKLLNGVRERPDLRLRPKRHPLSLARRALLLAAIGVCGVIPYADELRRCVRVDPHLHPRPKRALPPTESLRVEEEGRPLAAEGWASPSGRAG
ncbi:hypothetical protein GCM10022226_44560 [Sphaerisporangium flaviroseum]|uniref:Diguanylate cyclase n=1 Tax=Sphaerisporangium flaviroseum TaxID=509199 RepID=A0ABP7IIA9_9ACTN